MKLRPLSRRTLLRGVGGIAIALPWLDAMEARAQSAPPKRYVFMFSANGTMPSTWTPTGTETSFTLSPILKPLEPYKSKLLILDNVNMRSADFGPGDGHQRGMGHLLTGTELQGGGLFPGGGGDPGSGWAGGISVDQQMAKTVGAGHKFQSLEFGVQVSGNTVWSRMSYLGAGQPVPPENNPMNMFNRLFGNFMAPTTTVDTLAVQRKSVLDAVRGEIGSLNGKLGASDRAKLDAHLTAVRDVELRLTATATQPSGSGCVKPGAPPQMDYYSNANYPAVGKLQMDLLVMALACNLTRVATLQWSNSVSQKSFPFLGFSDTHHDLSHYGDSDTTANTKITKINTWYAEQYAYLIGKMAAITEGGGSLLDNSIVLWGNELGKGNSHTRYDIPFVMAGSGGGYFRTGRYLKYSGAFHNNLHVSCLNAMGINTNTFGNPAYCTGPLPNLV